MINYIYNAHIGSKDSCKNEILNQNESSQFQTYISFVYFLCRISEKSGTIKPKRRNCLIIENKQEKKEEKKSNSTERTADRAV